MDFETTFSTIAAQLPESLDQVIDHAVSYIPEELTSVIKHASSYFPAELDFITAAKFMLFFATASLVMGVLGRIFLGKRSSLNHSLSSVMGILFIYAVTVTVFTFKPWDLEQLLSPLPFVNIFDQYMVILPIQDSTFPALCSEILSLIILAFLVNLLDTFIPQGNNALSWYLLRFLSIIFSMLLHFGVTWAFETYLPNVLVAYAPTILLILLVFMLFSGALNLILGLFIAAVNPFIGAMYTFFFSTVVGKQLTKAVFTSAIICGIVFLLGEFGFTVISISISALTTYIPVAIILLLLWYLIGHVL